MPAPSEKPAVFDFETATLLGNLKQKLELSSNWKRDGRGINMTAYSNGNYCLVITTDTQTRNVEQITVEAASATGDGIGDVVQAVFDLAIVVISEVDPSLSLNERAAIINEICDFADMPQVKEKVVNGILYSCQVVRNQNMWVSVQRLSTDD